MSDKKGLSGLVETLNEAFGDLSTLDVTTYTGNVDVAFSGEGDNRSLDLDALFRNASQLAIDGGLSLMLATQVNIDGDATNFVAKGEIPEYIIRTHSEAVKNGSEFRGQIISFLGEKVAGVLK